MISSLVTLVAVLSSLAAANGAIVQRDTPTITGSVTFSATTTPTVSPSTTVTTTVSLPKTASTTVSSTPTGTPTSGAISCNNAQNWQAAFAYAAGAQAIFNNDLYTAKQWTYNNAPTTHPDQWTHVGTCSQPINNKANCNGISAWQGNVAYTSGSKVTHQGHLWSTVQWAYANSPADSSGSWQDLGACA